MLAIPMLSHFARQFEVDGADGPAGRKGRVFTRLCATTDPTRKKLAERMGIRPATISDIVLDLIGDGLVLEARPDQVYQKGRPEILLRPNPNALTAIVCNTVSNTVHCALVNFAGEILHCSETQTRGDRIDKSAFLDIVVDLYKDCLGRVPNGARHIGAAISLPGIVDEERLIWRYSAHWPELRDLDLSVLSDRIANRITVSKNLDCELRARMSRRGHPPSEGVLLLHWGFGIGAAFQRGHDLQFLNKQGFGEVGHSCVDVTSRAVCKCGMTGCVEAEAGLWALTRKPGARDIPTEEWKFEQFLCDNPDLDIWYRPIDLVAMTLRNLCVTLSPDQCIVTGPFAQSKPIFSRLVTRFEEFLPQNSLVVGKRRTKLHAGRAGTEDEIIGASATVFRPALADLCGA